MQNHKLYEATKAFIEATPYNMVVLELDKGDEYTFKPVGDYTEIVTETFVCAKCENGQATLVTTTKVDDVTVANGTILDTESFVNMTEYEALLWITLFNEGKLKPLYKRADLDGDGDWDELQRYDVDGHEYVAVTPDRVNTTVESNTEVNDNVNVDKIVTDENKADKVEQSVEDVKKTSTDGKKSKNKK